MVGGLRAAGGVAHSDQGLRRVRGAGQLQAQGFGGVAEPAEVRRACDLRLTEFDGGKYRGLDLRGNTLSQLRGLGSLKQIVIDQAQTLQLAEALAAELDVTFGEDLDDK
ncbi:hypothetical protein [Streptomyces sp. NPDC059783]|uniref:hypothetical protein n=1 Tax=Streptomyces sp. NPDC059783 TaxID=3346944 RepID=UPI00364FB60A